MFSKASRCTILLPLITTMPIIALLPPGELSIVSSTTTFMKGSKPLRTPVTCRWEVVKYKECPNYKCQTTISDPDNHDTYFQRYWLSTTLIISDTDFQRPWLSATLIINDPDYQRLWLSAILIISDPDYQRLWLSATLIISDTDYQRYWLSTILIFSDPDYQRSWLSATLIISDPDYQRPWLSAAISDSRLAKYYACPPKSL